MTFLRLFLLVLTSGPLQLISTQEDTNVLIYGDSVQISSEINEGETIVAKKPIQGTLMITHDEKNPVDLNSVTMGGKHLKLEFVKTVSMSSYSNLGVDVYQFQLEGMDSGFQTLPPIKVKVGGKEYEAPPLMIRVPD